MKGGRKGRGPPTFTPQLGPCNSSLSIADGETARRHNWHSACNTTTEPYKAVSVFCSFAEMQQFKQNKQQQWTWTPPASFTMPSCCNHTTHCKCNHTVKNDLAHFSTVQCAFPPSKQTNVTSFMAAKEQRQFWSLRNIENCQKCKQQKIQVPSNPNNKKKT